MQRILLTSPSSPLSRFRLLLSVGFLIAHGISAQNFDYAGCSSRTVSACIDPIPATYTSGSWIETDGSSEWTITAPYASPGGQGSVSGFVYVWPPSGMCPVVKYTASGQIYPTYIDGSEASTGFDWWATSPNPSGTCQGYTPVTSMRFHNSPYPGILNKGNDWGTGIWTNSSGLSGALTIETNLILTPTSETLYPFTYFDPNGWGGNSTSPYRTQLDLMQSLQDSAWYDPPDPNLNKFQGRQVYETANGAATDTCYDTVDPSYVGLNKTLRAAINKSIWNVGWGWGNANDYGPDGIGFTTPSIDFYRLHSTIPCTVTLPQAMYIVSNMPGYPDELFATHTLSWTVYPTTVTVQKDGYSVTQNY